MKRKVVLSHFGHTEPTRHNFKSGAHSRWGYLKSGAAVPQGWMMTFIPEFSVFSSLSGADLQCGVHTLIPDSGALLIFAEGYYLWILQLLNSRFTSRTVRKTDSLQSSQRRAHTMLLSAWGVFYIPRLTATMLHFRAMPTTQQSFSVSSHPVFVIILAINTLTVHWHTSHSSTACLWCSEG